MSENAAIPQKTTKTDTGRKLFCIVLIAVTILFDQLSKWMVTQMLIAPQIKAPSLDFMTWITTVTERFPYAQIEVTPFLNVVMVWNYGVSFGLFNNQSTENALVLVGIAAILAFILLVWMLGHKDQYVSAALALAVGGAFGNIIDRMRFGAVVDFIDVHAYGHHWPAFNLADSCIVLGIGFVILHSLFLDKDQTPKKDGNKTP